MRVNKLFLDKQGIKVKNLDLDIALGNLDTVLFDKIPSQTSPDDKNSLLALQNYMRSKRDKYVYLEIGSYYGGSLAPHMIDPKCVRIYSIDKRPGISPDNRFPEGHVYENEVKTQMLMSLKAIAKDLDKLIIYDSDASDVDVKEIKDKVDLCFIDAEHTDTAVESDFKFCHQVLSDDGVILFHDAFVVRDGIRHIMKWLKANNIKACGCHLNSSIYAIMYGKHPLLDAYISSQDLRRELTVVEKITWNFPNWIRKLWKR